MRNQTSFRLTTTLLPTDMTAKTTQVINKVDSDGNKFYPTFSEETVVLTNDDRTIMETTRASCSNWVLTFTKRGLSDDASETPVANRKLTRNPWTIAFITVWAWDFIDKDDNITWTWNQTYTWSATYSWLLTTQKWVQYPSFADVTALNAYPNPFGWMFAVVNSTWELYRYNAVTEQWDLVSTVELSQFIIRASSTKPAEWTPDNIVTISKQQHWIYQGEDTLVDGDYVESVAKSVLPWIERTTTWNFLKACQQAWTAHNITSATYTFVGIWYLKVNSFFWYAAEINDIIVFYERFDGGTYVTKYPCSLYTLWPWDVVEIYRPWDSWGISFEMVDYY